MTGRIARASCESRTKVEREHRFEDLVLQIPELDSARVAADGIHDSVELTMTREDAGNKLGHLMFIDNIDNMALESRCIRCGGTAQGIEFLLLAIGDDDACALLKEGERDRAAQAAGSARDEHNLA